MLSLLIWLPWQNWRFVVYDMFFVGVQFILFPSRRYIDDVVFFVYLVEIEVKRAPIVSTDSTWRLAMLSKLS